MTPNSWLIIGSAVAALVTSSPTWGQATRDSAGIRITIYDAERPTARIVVARSPSIDIGGGDDERADLDRVGDVRGLRNGTLVVGDRGATELKFFGTDGRFLRSAGRKGTGPGEFQWLERVWVTPEDSIVIADGTLRRFVVFDREGRHARTVPIETPANRRTPRLLDFLAPDVLLGGSSDVTELPARPEPYHFAQVVYAIDLAGQVRASLGRFGEGEHFVQPIDPTHPERGNSYWDRAFGRQTTVRAVGDLVAIGDGQTAEIRLYTPAGGLSRILRGRQQAASVTPADRAAFRVRTLAASAQSPMPSMKAMTERMVAAMPFPDRFPAYERFESDPTGRLWLKRYARPSDSTEVWTALGSDGTSLGQVELPPRTRLRTVMRQAFLCVWRDADDVEHVRVYPFQIVPTARQRR